MAHELESMFYVSNEQNGRFVPWHGLGTSVSEALTSAEAIKVAGLDWTVESKPILTVEAKVINGFKANTRSTDGTVLGIVSDRYQIVQNSEAFDFTDNLIGNGVTYETAGSLKNGKRVWLLAKLPSRMILDDKFDPYICFTNTHDGLGAIKVCMTPIRVVCNNTLNVALSNAKRSWSTKHVGDIQTKMREAKATLLMANEYMSELAIKADELANTKITEAQIDQVLTEVFPVSEDDSDRKKRNVKELKDNFMACYFAPDIAKFVGTQWGVINAMTDMVDHKIPKRATSTYAENNWGRIIDGHIIVDTTMLQLAALNKSTIQI